MCQRAVARHETVLGEVEFPHRAVEERGQETPIACLPMGNVVVVVELSHRLEGESRILVRQTALRARHEPEPSGPAGEVVFREKQLGALRAATQVAVTVSEDLAGNPADAGRVDILFRSFGRSGAEASAVAVFIRLLVSKASRA